MCQYIRRPTYIHYVFICYPYYISDRRQYYFSFLGGKLRHGTAQRFTGGSRAVHRYLSVCCQPTHYT